MTIEFVEALDADHIGALRELDTSFASDRSYRFTRTTSGFQLTEEQLARPLRKCYDLSAELESGRSPWDAVALAWTGGHVVGMAATTFEAWNRRQVLNELHVAPSMRRRGLARRLLAEVHRCAGRNGAREIWVETQNVNAPAIAAYLRLGFHLTGVDVSRYAPPHDDEVAIFLSCPVKSPS